MRNVTIKEQAFIGMIASAVEVYKKECFGVIVGRIHKHHFLIIDSYTFQTAKRDYEYVTVKKLRRNRLNESLAFFTKAQVLGDFHSHPDGPHHFSDWDRKEIIKDKSPLSILISVHKIRKSNKWTNNKDLSITGTLGKKYLIKISAFHSDGKHVKPIKIVCPFIKKINNLKSY